MLLRRSASKFLLLIVTPLLFVLAAAQNPSSPPRKIRPRMPAATNAPLVPVSQGSWSQLAKLVEKEFTSSLGASVAVSGETVVLGQNPVRSRLAYVYQGSSAGWNTLPVATLASLNSKVVLFAIVAIDGDTIVIGTPAFENDGPGYAYVYVKPAGGWTDMHPTAVLTPSGTNDGFFGGSVAISGDTIVVGDVSYDTAGTAYVYVKPAGGWTSMTETARLTASDELPTSEFSESVSVSGNTIAVGAPGSVRSTGKAYVFVEPAGGWMNMTETAKLAASDALTDARVGNSISIDGNNIVVGAPNPATIPGAAYVFTKPATGWTNMTQTAKLSAADGVASDYFGGLVSISGNLVIVGASFRGTAPYGRQGGIYVFQQPAGGWQNASSSTVLTASDAHHNASFGGSLSINGKTVVGGSDAIVTNAAYVFGLP